MTRKGLYAAMAVACAVLAGPQASATLNFGQVSSIINQFHYNSSFSGNSFSIVQNGQSQILFTGLAGLRQFNNLNQLNSWANSGGYQYTPTFSGVGNFFSGGGGGPSYNYTPTFAGIGSYFGTQGGSSYSYSPTFSGLGNYFATQGGSGYRYTPTYTGTDDYFDSEDDGNAPKQFSASFKMSQAVPEPSTWAFMIVGFLAVGSAMRRRKRATDFA